MWNIFINIVQGVPSEKVFTVFIVKLSKGDVPITTAYFNEKMGSHLVFATRLVFQQHRRTLKSSLGAESFGGSANFNSKNGRRL